MIEPEDTSTEESENTKSEELDNTQTEQEDTNTIISSHTKTLFDNDFPALLEALTEAMLVADQYGKIVLANTLAEKLFNYTKAELLDLYIEDFMPVRFREQHISYRTNFLQKPFARPMNFEVAKQNFHGIKKNREEFVIDISLSPIKTHEKSFILIGIRDLTEHRVYEKKLEEQIAESAKQSTLAIARKEQNQAMQKFIDTICHEVRTPLHGIFGGMFLLKESLKELEGLYSADQPELFTTIREQLDIINQSMLQQKIIVDDVLTMDKLENNKLTLNEICFELTQTIKNALKMFATQIELKHLTLILNIPQHNVWIKTDPNQLSVVIVNLMSNAIKFTHDGSITFVATTTSYNQQYFVVDFMIKDTGIGMSTEELSKLFECFTQANHHIGSQYGGSGLGLAISKKIVELMNGSIHVKSRNGNEEHGTEFSFSIKCKSLTAEEQLKIVDQNISSDSLNVVQTPRLSGKKILIVEDNPINTTILVGMLKKTGCICRSVDNGQKALEEFIKHNFSLIFMDLNIPIINGTDVTIKIRSQETHNHIPIICISANANPSTKIMALESGMDYYLTKPFIQNDLFRLISKCIENQHPLSIIPSSSSLELHKLELHPPSPSCTTHFTSCRSSPRSKLSKIDSMEFTTTPNTSKTESPLSSRKKRVFLQEQEEESKQVQPKTKHTYKKCIIS